MAKNWGAVSSAQMTAWSVPASETQELSALTAAVESALDAAKNETTRMPVATARCRAAFDALADKMRDIKKRCFYAPPLTDAGLAALGLSPADMVHTPSGVPTAQVTVRKKGVARFDYGHSGKTRMCNTAYFAGRIENGGKQGPGSDGIGAYSIRNALTKVLPAYGKDANNFDGGKDRKGWVL